MILTGWQRTWIRILTTMLTIAMMIIIFCFSMETAEKSDQRSGVYTNFIISVIHPEYEQLTPDDQQRIYDSISMFIRKLAHFTEYTFLGILLRLCMESWFGHRKLAAHTLPLISFLAGTFYAATDELHQILIDGRSGQFVDVLVHACGVLFGVILGAMLIRHICIKHSNGG